MFRFKQFSVQQNKCAMKVNTDGVLLGAWANVSEAKSILDIGSGTGVIALMLAQKNTEAIVDAIDIDEYAYEQAKENFEHSKWNNRLNAFHSSLQNFAVSPPLAEVARAFQRDGGGCIYDIVISNPPYFVDDLKTGNQQKDLAKHSTALTYEELLSGINLLLQETGKAFLVIPIFNVPLIEAIGEKENLFISKLAEVIAVTGKNPYLVLLQLEREKKEPVKETITIQDADCNFTAQYKQLTKEFYLKF